MSVYDDLIALLATIDLPISALELTTRLTKLSQCSTYEAQAAIRRAMQRNEIELNDRLQIIYAQAEECVAA